MNTAAIVAVLVALVAAALAAPADHRGVEIVRYDNDNIGIDGYNFAYETSDGVKREESAVVKNLGSDVEEIQVKGRFSYEVDGQTYELNFIADANGYQPQAEFLPQ